MNDSYRGDSEVLFPLNRFYQTEQRVLPKAVLLPADALPQPYQGILNHDRDMTPTLESFFGETVTIQIIHRGQQGDAYTREVVLITAKTRKPVAYGSIDMHLENITAPARADILAGCLPFGTILSKHGITHVSAPSAFFEIESDVSTQHHFGLSEPARLYGRRNRLSLPDGKTLADIVEILAPIKENV